MCAVSSSSPCPGSWSGCDAGRVAETLFRLWGPEDGPCMPAVRRCSLLGLEGGGGRDAAPRPPCLPAQAPRAIAAAHDGASRTPWTRQGAAPPWVTKPAWRGARASERPRQPGPGGHGACVCTQAQHWLLAHHRWL